MTWQAWATRNYGHPCVPGNYKTIRIFGRKMVVHKQAVRYFRRINRCFRERTPDYHRYLCKQPDNWTYNCRNIAGTSVKSSHAWPLSIDLDSSTNARGTTSGTMRARGMAAIKQLEREDFTWGGRWNSPDDMHIELSEKQTPQAARNRYTRFGKRKRWFKKQTGG